MMEAMKGKSAVSSTLSAVKDVSLRLAVQSGSVRRRAQDSVYSHALGFALFQISTILIDSTSFVIVPLAS